jgi:hypothetical protein
MLELGEDVALAREALGQVAPQAGEQRKLQGDIALECPVGALRQPNHRHAPGAQLANQLVRANPFAGVQRQGQYGGRVGGAADPGKRGKQAGSGRFITVRQQRLAQGRRQRHVLRLQVLKPALASGRIEGQRLVQQPAEQRDLIR